MICREFDQQLDDYADGLLAQDQQSGIRGHLEQCADCRFSLQVHSEYLELMRRFPEPPAGPGRLAHMLRAARQRGETRVLRGGSRAGFLRGFASAAALASLGFVGLWQLQQNFEPVHLRQSSQLVAEQGLRRDVSVVIDVPADMYAANLTLEFPDPLRMAGLEDLHQVGWNVDLEAGPNLLTLPVTIAAGTDLTQSLSILARVRYDEMQRDFELPLTLVVEGPPARVAPLNSATLPNYRI